MCCWQCRRSCWPRQSGRRYQWRAWHQAACAPSRSGLQPCQPSPRECSIRARSASGLHRVSRGRHRPLSPAAESAGPWYRRRRRWFGPAPLAMRKTRFDDCTTASTFSGSATSTSLSSKGNCTSNDLPWPSVRRMESGKFPLAGTRKTDFCCASSPCARSALGSCASAAGNVAQAPTTASSALAVRLDFIRMVCQPFCRP